jgi:hypothetical protein
MRNETKVKGSLVNVRQIYKEILKNDKEPDKKLINIFGTIREEPYAYFNDYSKKQLGYSIDSMVISCTYNNMDCNLSDFYWFYDIDYGNCFKVFFFK